MRPALKTDKTSVVKANPDNPRGAGLALFCSVITINTCLNLFKLFYKYYL